MSWRWSALVAVALTTTAGRAGAEPAEPARPAPPVAWIGVGIEAGPTGVAITDVVEDSPAFVAGLWVGDEIVAIDTVRVVTPSQLIQAISSRPVGTVVHLTILRGASQFPLDLALEEIPSPSQILTRRLVGKPAPAFDLPIIGGDGRFALADLHGQVVMIEFWATWSQPCVVGHAALAEWTARRADAGLVTLAISGEAAALLTAYVNRAKPGFPVLRDPDGKVQARYFANRIPTLVVIDRDGVVVFAGTAETPLLPADGNSANAADASAANFADAAFAAERALRCRIGDGEKPR